MPSPSKRLSTASAPPTAAPLASSSTPASTPATRTSAAAYKCSIPSVSPPTNGAPALLGSSDDTLDAGSLLSFERLRIAEQPTKAPHLLAGGMVGSYGNFLPLLRPGTEGGGRQGELGAAVGLGQVGGALEEGIRHGKCKFFNASKVGTGFVEFGRRLELTAPSQGFGFLLDSQADELNGDEGAFAPSPLDRKSVV